ncbi:hypothetical protein AHAS_Ahas10G0113800 [Arachis hypogaea]
MILIFSKTEVKVLIALNMKETVTSRLRSHFFNAFVHTGSSNYTYCEICSTCHHLLCLPLANLSSLSPSRTEQLSETIMVELLHLCLYASDLFGEMLRPSKEIKLLNRALRENESLVLHGEALKASYPLLCCFWVFFIIPESPRWLFWRSANRLSYSGTEEIIVSSTIERVAIDSERPADDVQCNAVSLAMKAFSTSKPSSLDS